MTLKLEFCQEWTPAPGETLSLNLGEDPCAQTQCAEWPILNFCEEWTPAPGGPVVLDFGVCPCGEAPIADSAVTVAATLEPPYASIRIDLVAPNNISVVAAIPPPYAGIGIDFITVHNVAVAFQMPEPVPAIDVWYDNAVWRGIAARENIPHQQGDKLANCLESDFTQAGNLKSETCSTFSEGLPQKGETDTHWITGIRTRNDINIPHQAAERIRDKAICAPHIDMKRIRKAITKGRWEEATREQPDTVCAPWIELFRTARPHTCLPWQMAEPIQIAYLAQHKEGTPTHKYWCFPWQKGKHTPGWGPPEKPIPPPIIPPCYWPEPGWAELKFKARDKMPTEAALHFVCPDKYPPVDPPDGQIIIPIRKVYYMANTATLTRVSDGEEIPAFQLSAAIDHRSWVWTLRARIPIGAQSIVESDDSGPVELEARVNGHVWRFYAERITRSRKHGGKSLQVSGRGIAASLDTPYSDERIFDAPDGRTAVQLMNEALSINGQPIGWTIDASAITDWLVTAGAWNFYGSRIGAVNRIAASIDALVQADQWQKTIYIKPRYPVLPWKWAEQIGAPGGGDIIMPEDVIVQEGLEWADMPEYNAVYVSGVNQGIMGQISIAGTAGDKQALMVTDPLITHADAARQRGGAILGNTGRQQRLRMSMPLEGDTQIPVIHPGKFLKYGPQETVALVRSTRIDANRPTFRQYLDLEVHLDQE